MTPCFNIFDAWLGLEVVEVKLPVGKRDFQFEHVQALEKSRQEQVLVI